MHRGYIKLWRKFMDTSFYRKPNTLALAVHLLLECNREDKVFTFNEKPITIKRGQVLTGLHRLQEDTGISIRSLRTAIHSLTNSGFLTSKTTNRFTVFTIGKYHEYQDKPTSQPTNKRQTNDKQTTTNKNDKNDKNDKNTTTAPAKPDAEGKGTAPVNWENCRTDLQRLIAHFVKITTPDLYANCSQAQATGIFRVQGRAASEILKQCGDIATARRVLDKAAKYFYDKGLDWSLHAVNRSCTDYVNEILKERNYAPK